jgi:hypothetical protein
MGYNAFPRDRRIEALLSRITPARAPGDAVLLAVATDLPSLLDLLNRLGCTKEVEVLTIIGSGGDPIPAAPGSTSSQQRIEGFDMCGVDNEKNGGCSAAAPT